MSLRRTPSALYSLHIFFKVDAIVFCEGGAWAGDGTKDIDYYAQPSDTLDTLYWQNVVKFLCINRSFHFKSIGCKSTIKSLAEDVSKLKIEHIIVCTDSDYDRYTEKSQGEGRIARTFGYSWENDVVTQESVNRVIHHLLGPTKTYISVKSETERKFSKLSEDLSKWVEIDISLKKRGKVSVFDRDKPLSSIDMASPPDLRVEVLTQRLKGCGYERRPRKIVSVTKELSTRVCFGKLVSRSIYQTVITSIRRYTTLRVDYDVFMRLAITGTFDALRDGILADFREHLLSQSGVFTQV